MYSLEHALIFMALVVLCDTDKALRTTKESPN